jgi:hypothetical protein
VQYSTYKNSLQQLAQKIGDVEQEAEEHKYEYSFFFPDTAGLFWAGAPRVRYITLALITPLDAAF